MPHPILCIFSGYITFSLPQSFQISSHIFRLCSLSISLHFILSSHFSLSFFCPINTLLLSSHSLCQSLSLSFILHPCLCVTPPHLPVSMTCFELQLVLLADDDSQTVSSVYQNYIFWAQCIQAVDSCWFVLVKLIQITRNIFLLVALCRYTSHSSRSHRFRDRVKDVLSWYSYNYWLFSAGGW